MISILDKIILFIGDAFCLTIVVLAGAWSRASGWVSVVGAWARGRGKHLCEPFDRFSNLFAHDAPPHTEDIFPYSEALSTCKPPSPVEESLSTSVVEDLVVSLSETLECKMGGDNGPLHIWCRVCDTDQR